MKLRNYRRLLSHFFLVICINLLLITESVESLDLFQTNYSSKNTGEFTAAVGADISINCTARRAAFLSNFELKKGVTVVWKWKPQDSEEWIHLKKESLGDGQKYLGAQNNLLEYDQATSKKIVISKLPVNNVTVNSSGLYGCFIKESKSPLDQTLLYVGYPPDKPKHLRCITDSYLHDMNCSWDAGRPTYINTTYQMVYNISKGLEIESHTTETMATYICLDVTSTYTFVYNVQTAAFNALDHSRSEISAFIPGHCVELDAPTNVTISAFGDTDKLRSTCLLVTWIEPDGSSHLKLLYEIRYRRTGRGESWAMEEVDKTEVILTNLEPFTSYDVQLYAYHNTEGLLGGEDSDWSKVVSYSTEFSAPSEKFLFLSINATSYPAPPDKWEVKLTWMFYERHSEPGFYYKVLYSMFGKTYQLKPLANRATFIVNGSGRIVITGSFCNSKGCSSAAYETIDVKKASPIINDVRLSLLSGNAPEINWKTEDTDLSFENDCIGRLCYSSRDPNGFHSMFTADVNSTNESALACTFDPNYDVRIHCSAGQLTMPRADISPCQQYYAMVISVHSSGISNTMTTSTPSNVVKQNPVITTTGSFSATDGSTQAHYQIHTEWEWKESLCINLHKDLSFSVFYAPISGGECTESTPCSGNRPFHSTIGECFQNITSHEITSNIYGATKYNLSLGYCCKPTTTSSSTLCFAASNVTDQVETRIGAPGIPLQLHWNESDVIVKAVWSPPSHRNGPLDGYKVKYGRKLNTSNTESGTINDSDFTEVITNMTSINLPIQCSSDVNDSTHWVNVSAFNLIAGKQLIGQTERLEEKACVAPNDVDADWSRYVSIIVGATVCLIFVIIFLLVGHYYRMRIKQIIRNSLWPPVPMPNVFIDLPTNTESNEFSNDLPSNVAEDYSNPLFARDRDMESTSSYEIPDNIHDVSNCIKSKDLSKENDETEVGPANEISSMEEPCWGVPNYALEKEELNPAKQYTLDAQDGQYDGSEHSPYSVITPLLSLASDNSEIGDYAKANIQGNEPFWRMMLYPNGAASYSHQCAAGSRKNRPHSYNGSSGNSFTAAGYVRQCEDRLPTNFEFNRSRFNSHQEPNNQHENQPVITYAKLAVDVEGGPTLVENTPSSQLNVDDASSVNAIQKCSCNGRRNAFTKDEGHASCKCSFGKQNLRRLRGESWYDGYNCCQASVPSIGVEPTAKQSFQQSSTNNPPSYVGKVASYVLVPTANQSMPIHGVTTDCTSDDDLDRNTVHLPNDIAPTIRKCSSSSVDSIDALYRDVRGSHSPQNIPQIRDNKTHERLQNGGMELPTEDDPLSYIKQCDTYVTVDEALSIPADTSLPTSHNGANFLCNSYNDQLDNSTFPRFRFDDGEDVGLPEESFSMDNAVTHLFQGQNFRNAEADNDSHPHPFENDDASEFGYITTVEASDKRK